MGILHVLFYCGATLALFVSHIIGLCYSLEQQGYSEAPAIKNSYVSLTFLAVRKQVLSGSKYFCSYLEMKVVLIGY